VTDLSSGSQNEGKEIYTQVHLDEDAYTRGLDVSKARMRIHALSCKEKRVHVGNLFLVRGS
jgi:hypothetical protein